MTLPTAVSASDWAALLADDSALTGGVAAICSRHRVDAAHVTRYADGSLPVYAIGDTHVIKLFPPHEGDFAAVEARALGVVHGALPVPTPQPLAAGDIDGWHYILMSQLHGQPLARAWPRLAAADRDGLAYQLGRCVAALHAIDIEPVADIAPRWDAFMRAQRESAVERQRSRGLDPHWLQQIPAFLDAWMPADDGARALLHSELMREHLLASNDAPGWRISGLFDFEPAMVGAPEYDFASFGLFVSCRDGRFLRRALLAYGYPTGALDSTLQCRFMAYAILHRYSNLRWYLERLSGGGATTLEGLAARWWSVRD